VNSESLKSVVDAGIAYCQQLAVAAKEAGRVGQAEILEGFCRSAVEYIDGLEEAIRVMGEALEEIRK
jgi:hypothetical protein